MKKINFCKATTIILIINVILSIVLFFVVPDKIAIQWVGPPQQCSRFLLCIFDAGIVSAFCFYGKTYFYNVPV